MSSSPAAVLPAAAGPRKRAHDPELHRTDEVPAQATPTQTEEILGSEMDLDVPEPTGQNPVSGVPGAPEAVARRDLDLTTKAPDSTPIAAGTVDGSMEAGQGTPETLLQPPVAPFHLMVSWEYRLIASLQLNPPRHPPSHRRNRVRPPRYPYRPPERQILPPRLANRTLESRQRTHRLSSIQVTRLGQKREEEGEPCLGQIPPVDRAGGGSWPIRMP